MKTIFNFKKQLFISLLSLLIGNAWGQPSAQDVITDLNSQVGNCIDMDGAYGCQCVDLAKYVCITYWGQNIVGNANQLDELNRWPTGTIKINYYAGFIPQQGDFYIWDNYGTNGHIGLINTANSTSYTSLDENFINPSSNGSPLANVNHSNYNNFTCVMRLPYSSCPSIPNTITPSNTQTNVGVPVNFDWTDASGNSPQYRIQVSTVNSGWSASNGFTTATAPTATIRVNQGSLTLSEFQWDTNASTIYPPQAFTTYYYTVKSFACGQNSNWSTVKSFTTGCLATTANVLTPTNGQTNVTLPVNFDWSDSSGTNPNYRIQVSTSPNNWTAFEGFTTAISPNPTIRVNDATNGVSSFSWTSTASYPPLNGITYYWSVKTFACGNNAQWSPVRSFTIGNVTPCNPATATLISPTNGTTYNVGQNISLQWTGIENGCAIQDYQIEITAPNGNSTSPIQTSSNFDFTAPSNGLGTWQWRVRARNINGVYGNYTSSRTFIISQVATNYIITTSSLPNVGGSTSGDGTFNNGDSCYITATPNTGYTFINWTENGVLFSTNQNLTFTVTGNKNLVANFLQNQTGTCVSCPNYDFSTSINSSWGTQSSSILSNGCKIYRFLAVPGNTYTFKTGCEDGASTSFDSVLDLLDINCAMLSSNDDYCPPTSKIIWTCNYTSTNWVYLKVKGYQTAFGNYTLAYTSTPTM
jgi:Divergent InlB B-repeat domain